MKLRVSKDAAERKITLTLWRPANVMEYETEVELVLPVKSADELEGFKAGVLDMYDTVVDMEWLSQDYIMTLYDVERDGGGKVVRYSVHVCTSKDEACRYSGTGFTFSETGRHNKVSQRKVYIDRVTVNNLEAEVVRE